ncbi:MAG: DUF4388 domain-containing protein [Myxococcota bacterium]
MAAARKILLADPDLEAVRALSKALRLKGYQVHYAPDGSKALEVTVLRHPDLVLFDDACLLIDARSFQQILRTNPRTDDIPVVLTTTNLAQDKVRAFSHGCLKKPFNLDEVLSRIEHVFRRSEAAKELRGQAREIEGNLSQLGIGDLLQILAMNKKSGRLTLERNTEQGEVHVSEGRPVNAKLGPVEGEKALFRLLSWTEGSFAFEPMNALGRVRIVREMDEALLEGLRQADEAARLYSSLPSRQVRVVLSPEATLSGDQHPVTAQVVELLRTPRTISELLDLAPATDLDVLVVLSTLMQKGVARVAAGEAEPGHAPLLGPAEIHALRARLLRGRQPSHAAIGKIFVCAQGPSALQRFLSGLSGLVPASSPPRALKSGFGTVGRYELSEVLKVDFCVLPHGEAARPLWRPFCTGAVGALLLDVAEPTVKLARFLGLEMRVPVVVVGASVPAELVPMPAGAVSVEEDWMQGVRALLLRASHPAQPSAP